MTDNDAITQIKQRLLELDKERSALLSSLQRLEQKNVTTRSSQEKIAIFQNLFQGRSDVYPKRWENQKTGIVMDTRNLL